ncbi:MAG: hypothetical protein WCG63_07735 [Opitutaceae bacterium]
MKQPQLLALVSLLALISLASLSAASMTSITYPASSGPGQTKHIVFLTGDEEYRSEEGLPMLAKILSQRYGFTCTVLFALDPDGTINPDNNTSLSDPAALDRADGIVMGLRFRQWPDATMQHFAAAVSRGIPIVALRTSTHAFNFPAKSSSAYKSFNNFGREVLGENWVSHWGANRRGATRGIIEPGAESDPLLRGVTAIFGDSGVYETHPVADSKILVRGQVLTGMSPTDAPDTYLKKRKSDGVEQPINEPLMPIAWTRLNHNTNGTTNRVFCTTMGAASDLANEDFRRLVINAVLAGFAIEIPERTDVSYIDAYTPTPYAFKGYRRGLTPADHALGQALRAGTPPPPVPAKKD